MIGRITGLLVEKNPPRLLVEVGGVGYVLEAPMSTFYELPVTGQTTSLHVHMIVREDAQLLFGFASLDERSLFRSLLKVNGVGAKVALAILSGMSAGDFSKCITLKDVATLTRIPGIGKKTAERLVVEMADKLPAESALAVATDLAGNIAPETGSAKSQAVEALIALGYKAPDASRLVKSSGLAEGAVEDYIRAALKAVNPG